MTFHLQEFLALLRLTYRTAKLIDADIYISSREQLGVLSFLMHFDIHIAKNWWSNVDSEIKQIRSVHTGRRKSLFFSCEFEGSTSLFVLVKGPPGTIARAYK